MLKTVQASRLVGTRAILEYALSDAAQASYQHFGFTSIPTSSQVTLITLRNTEATAEQVPS